MNGLSNQHVLLDLDDIKPIHTVDDKEPLKITIPHRFCQFIKEDLEKARSSRKMLVFTVNTNKPNNRV